MTRAEKFIDKFEGLRGLLNFIPKSALPELLEQFHKECQPTDAEINKQFPFTTGFCRSQDDHIADIKRCATKWCRDFVREDPVAPKVSPTEKKVERGCDNCLYALVNSVNYPCSVCCGTNSHWQKQPKEPTLEDELKNIGRFVIGKKEPTLEDEINALKEPTVENATTHDLLTELIKRNLK
jgi:hypothetical protein